MRLWQFAVLVVTSGCEKDCPKAAPCPPPVPAPVTVASDAAATPTGSSLADTLDFIRLGYGDLHDRNVRSLSFVTECLSTSTMKEALKLVPDYNAFNGPRIADAIEALRGEVSCWEFGREGSPVIYVHFAYWLGQQEKACPQRYDGGTPCAKPDDDRRLTASEHADLATRARTLFEGLHADEISFDTIQTRKLRLWWD